MAITDWIPGLSDEDRLSAEACAESVKRKVKGVQDLAANAKDLFTLDFSGAGNLADQFRALGEENYIDWFEEPGKKAWQTFALGQAEAGTFLASADDPLPWFQVTHRNCKGTRTTFGPQNKKDARLLGFLLAQPKLRNRNSFTVANLNNFHKQLKSLGMDGLDPVWSSIIEGFQGMRFNPALFEGLQVSAPTLRKIIKENTKTSGVAMVAALIGAIFFLG